jgi:hypothetical protein
MSKYRQPVQGGDICRPNFAALVRIYYAPREMQVMRGVHGPCRGFDVLSKPRAEILGTCFAPAVPEDPVLELADSSRLSILTAIRENGCPSAL